MAEDLSTSVSPKNQKKLTSPWAQVVRGGKETVSATPRSPSSPVKPNSSEKSSSSDCVDGTSTQVAAAGGTATAESSGDNVSGIKKSVWIKPVNGVVEAAPVMGDAWPTITESTRVSSKSSDSLKADSSISTSQVHLPKKQAEKQGNPNGNTNFSSNHKHQGRPRPTKRGGGTSGGAGHSGFSRPPPPPPTPPPFPIPFGFLPPMTELPAREPAFQANSSETTTVVGVGSHSYNGNDHSSQRNSSRRGNFNSRPRGDGMHYNGHGGRRDQDRSWNAPRNSTARDIRLSQMAPPPPPPPRFVRPGLSGSMPFLPPHHVRPYGNPIAAVDFVPPFMYVPPLPPDSLRGVPFIPPPHPPMFFPIVDPNLPSLLVNQIDYYFSDDNLVKDEFLRSNMDEQGWVHISLIASFPRVLSLTNNVKLILDALGASTVVEVQGDKIRRRENWKKWLPPSSQGHPGTALQSPSGSTEKVLATFIEKVSLDEENTSKSNHIEIVDANSEVVPGNFSSEEPTGQSKVANGEENAGEIHD